MLPVISQVPDLEDKKSGQFWPISDTDQKNKNKSRHPGCYIVISDDLQMRYWKSNLLCSHC